MSDMLSHEFSLRGKILLVICAIVGLSIFYYEVVWKGFRDSMVLYNTENLQNEIKIYETQISRKNSMVRYMDEHKDEIKGEIAIYNNLANEISELGQIFANVDEINISWNEPTLTQTTVRRNVNISFRTSGYTNVTDIIEAVSSCKYRCLISNLSITGDKDRNLNTSSDIRVNLTVTFYETVDENTSLEGLTIIGEQP